MGAHYREEIILVIEPGENLTASAIRSKVVHRRIELKLFGPITGLISLFNEEVALKYLATYWSCIPAHRELYALYQDGLITFKRKTLPHLPNVKFYRLTEEGCVFRHNLVSALKWHQGESQYFESEL